MTGKEIKKHIPSNVKNFDVIVAGGGPAGLGAATAAALMGAKTLLTEARSFLGGVAMGALWMPVNRLFINGGKSRGGVHELFVNAVKSLGKDAWLEGKTSWVDGDGLHIHPDYLRLAAFNTLEDAGCSYRLYSPVTGAYTENGKLKAALCATKNGEEPLTASVFIDATGDGDLAYFSGAPMVTGDQNGGALMPVTLGFAAANVDVEKTMRFYNGKNNLTEIYKEAGNRLGLVTAPWISFDRTSVPGVISINNGGVTGIGSLDMTDPANATLAERMNIELAIDFVKIAREGNIPGMENCSLVRVGAQVGVRETRRIVGEYVLNEDDAVNGTEFDDVVARRYGAYDPAGDQDGAIITMRSGYAFPYRSLIPKNIDSLLVAGRCSSYSHKGLAAGKSMGNMMAIGQAAGAAAAICAKSGVEPRHVDIHKIQEALRSMNVADI